MKLFNTLVLISCCFPPTADATSQPANWNMDDVDATASEISQRLKSLSKTGAVLISVPSLARMVSCLRLRLCVCVHVHRSTRLAYEETLTAFINTNQS